MQSTRKLSAAMSVFSTVLVLALASACGGGTQYIANTSVEQTTDNEQLIVVMEKYRRAMELRDVGKLLLLASKSYHDESGTVQDANDNLGYEQLKDALALRVSRAEDIRYSLRYKKIQVRQGIAYVDVLVDASFSYKDADGVEQRHTLRDINRFVLIQEGGGWLFRSGM